MKNIRARIKINYPGEPGNELRYDIAFQDGDVYITTNDGLLFDSYEEMRDCKIEKIYRRILEKDASHGGILSEIFWSEDTIVFLYGENIPWYYADGGPYVFILSGILYDHNGPVFQRKVKTLMRPLYECTDERLKNFGHPESEDTK